MAGNPHVINIINFPTWMLLEHSWGNADVLEIVWAKNQEAWISICVRYQMPETSFKASKGTSGCYLFQHIINNLELLAGRYRNEA